MTAKEYYESGYWSGQNPLDVTYFFAESYATYRLQFEREQQQQSWMPTEEEWKRFPEAKCAAMDNSGDVYGFICSLEDLELAGSHWFDKPPYHLIKTVDPTNLNWRQCKVARPEGV